MLEIVGKCVDLALSSGPRKELKEIYGDYYSPYYNLMYWLGLNVFGGMATAVELGVEKGRGVASLSAANPLQMDVYGYDTVKRPELDIVLEMYPRIHFHNIPSLPPKNVPEYKIDILHIDTEHSYAMAQEEFRQWEPHLSSPAVVLFDDLHAQEDGVLKYFYSLPYTKIQCDKLHPICGYGVLIYERQ